MEFVFFLYKSDVVCHVLQSQFCSSGHSIRCVFCFLIKDNLPYS